MATSATGLDTSPEAIASLRLIADELKAAAAKRDETAIVTPSGVAGDGRSSIVSAADTVLTGPLEKKPLEVDEKKEKEELGDDLEGSAPVAQRGSFLISESAVTRGEELTGRMLASLVSPLPEEEEDVHSGSGSTHSREETSSFPLSTEAAPKSDEKKSSTSVIRSILTMPIRAFSSVKDFIKGSLSATKNKGAALVSLIGKVLSFFTVRPLTWFVEKLGTLFAKTKKVDLDSRSTATAVVEAAAPKDPLEVTSN